MRKHSKLYYLGFLAMVLIGLVYPSWAEAANVIVYKYDYKDEVRDLEYPYFDGMNNKKAQDRMNRKIEQIVKSYMEDDKYVKQATLRYTVHMNEGNKVSISLDHYEYGGGAHGLYSLMGHTFNLDTGEEYRFSDLFTFDSASVQKINRLIAEQIRERNIVIFEPFKGLQKEPTFYLEPGNRVVLVFQPYEIAPFSSGILKFAFNY